MAGPPQPKQDTGFRPKRRAKRMRQFDRDFEAVKPHVRKRSGGICEVRDCTSVGRHHHHRAGRVGEGVNDPDMVILVCPEHDHRITTDPAWAKAEGYSVDRLSLPLSKSVQRPELASNGRND